VAGGWPQHAADPGKAADDSALPVGVRWGIDGTIASPGTNALPRIRQNPDLVMNPVKIAEAFYYLHTQDRSCWTHELQLTPFSTRPSY
jgi:hypothetical protein